MKKNIQDILNKIKIASKTKKTELTINPTLETLDFVKFLKRKRIIASYYQITDKKWTIYLNTFNNLYLIKNIKILNVKNKKDSISYKDYENSFNPFSFDIINTPFGYMDQYELQKYKQGGILVCHISFI